ncbi:MAG: hypothetical protein R3344_02450, partial [Acidobacteriota bacterium]|nr:hypothetical protein [Acidobacteriota bacterium]
SRFPGSGEFRGENPPYGALTTFSLSDEELPNAEELERRQEVGNNRKAAADAEAGDEDAEDDLPEITVRIRDAGGVVIREFDRPVHRGVNRVSWSLRRDAFKDPPRERPWWRTDPAGPEILPGSYEVELQYGEHKATRPVRVLPDPRFEIAQADRDAKWEAILESGALQETIAEAVTRIVSTRSDLDTVVRKRTRALNEQDDGDAKAKVKGDPVIGAANELRDRLTEIEKKLWTPPKTPGIVAEKDALSKVGYAMFSLMSTWEAPTPAQLDYLRQARALLDEILAELNEVFATDVAEFRTMVAEEGIDLFQEEEPLAIE